MRNVIIRNDGDERKRDEETRSWKHIYYGNMKYIYYENMKHIYYGNIYTIETYML